MADPTDHTTDFIILGGAAILCLALGARSGVRKAKKEAETQYDADQWRAHERKIKVHRTREQEQRERELEAKTRREIEEGYRRKR